MLKLELDWASDDTPDVRMASVGWDVNDDAATLVVEYDDAPGPAGWPTVRVYAWANDGAPAYRAGMLLDAWLRDVYGADEENAQELASLAEVV